MAEQFLGADEHREASTCGGGETPAGHGSVWVQRVGGRRSRNDDNVHEGSPPLREGSEETRDVGQGLKHVSGSRPRNLPARS